LPTPSEPGRQPDPLRTLRKRRPPRRAPGRLSVPPCRRPSPRSVPGRLIRACRPCRCRA